MNALGILGLRDSGMLSTCGVLRVVLIWALGLRAFRVWDIGFGDHVCAPEPQRRAGNALSLEP